MSVRPYGAAVRYGIPGVVLGLVLAGWLGGQSGLRAQASGPGGIERPRPLPTAMAGDSSGTLAMIAPLQQGAAGVGAQLLYLIDTKSKAFAVYRIDPTQSKGTIKLEGARQYHYDLQLTEYNNQEPDVATTKAAVSAAKVPH